MQAHEFASLVDAHAAKLMLYARQWDPAPEDVVQEAFLALVRLRQKPDDVLAWLYRVVRNAAIDAGKAARRRRQRETKVARPETWFVEPVVEGLDAEAAVTALQRLPADQRETIVARLWGGLNFEQIASVSGTSASTAFRRFTSGVAALRQELGVECPNPSAV